MELTEKNKNLILDALNTYFHVATTTLEKDNLGVIERQIWVRIKDDAKELLNAFLADNVQEEKHTMFNLSELFVIVVDGAEEIQVDSAIFTTKETAEEFRKRNYVNNKKESYKTISLETHIKKRVDNSYLVGMSEAEAGEDY